METIEPAKLGPACTQLCPNSGGEASGAGEKEEVRRGATEQWEAD